MPPLLISQIISSKISSQRKQENFGLKSPQKSDLDEYGTKVSNCSKFQISRKQLTNTNYFIPPETLPNTRSGTYFLATIFAKPLSRPTSESSEVNQFAIINHAPIVDICLKLSPSLLYLPSWTSLWLCPFYPPNWVDQHPQVVPAIQGKHSGTSYMSHVSPLTFKHRHLRTRSPWKAPDASRYMLLLARYVRCHSNTLRPLARERTTQSPLFMSLRAPATPCFTHLDLFTWLLAPTACSRFCTRLTHVTHTSHAPRYHTHVMSCHARSAQHVSALHSRDLHTFSVINVN